MPENPNQNKTKSHGSVLFLATCLILNSATDTESTLEV